MRELLAWTELADRADRLPGQLPRAEQRRAGLARALTLRPEVLLLDDPLSGLDARQAAWWLGVLDRLADGRALPGRPPLTLVATAASLHPWRGHARQCALLDGGRFTVLGGWDDAERSTTPVVREMLAAGPAA